MTKGSTRIGKFCYDVRCGFTMFDGNENNRTRHGRENNLREIRNGCTLINN